MATTVVDAEALTKLISKELEIGLYPQYIGREELALKKILKQRKFKFNSDLNGILLRFDNFEILSETGRIIDDAPLIFWKIKADFHVFNVEKNQIIKSLINRLGKKYFGCTFADCIDVTIKFDETIENEIENGNYFNLKLGDFIIFKVKSFVPSQRYIEGVIDRDILEIYKKVEDDF